MREYFVVSAWMSQHKHAFSILSASKTILTQNWKQHKFAPAIYSTPPDPQKTSSPTEEQMLKTSATQANKEELDEQTEKVRTKQPTDNRIEVFRSL